MMARLKGSAIGGCAGRLLQGRVPGRSVNDDGLEGRVPPRPASDDWLEGRVSPRLDRDASGPRGSGPSIAGTSRVEGPGPRGPQWDAVERVPPVGVDSWSILFTRSLLSRDGRGRARPLLHRLPRARPPSTPTHQTPHRPTHGGQAGGFRRGFSEQGESLKPRNS